MGWQAPQYVYPKYDTPMYGQALLSGMTEGAKTGMSMASNISAMATKKSLDAEVSQYQKEADTKLEKLKSEKEPEPVSAEFGSTSTIKSAMGGDEKLAAMAYGAPQNPSVAAEGVNKIEPDKALAMAGVNPLPTKDIAGAEKQALNNVAAREQFPDTQKVRRIEINADMHNKIIGAYRKHGFHKEALALEDQFVDQTLKVAALDYKAGQKIWNNSFLKDNYGEIDLTPKPKFKVVGDHGSYIKVNETDGTVTPIQSIGELKDLDPTHNVYMKVTDKDGKITWNQVQLGKPKEPTGDNIRKFNENGKEVTEELVDGKWVRKATSPQWKDGEGGDGTKGRKANMQLFDDAFVQNYGGGMADETGKAPDKNTVLAKMGKIEVKDKKDGKGNPITLQQLHQSMQEYYEGLLDGGTKPAEALNETLKFGQDFGNTNKSKVDLAIPKEHSNAVTQAMNKAKAAGARIGMDEKTGIIKAYYGDRSEVLWDGKAYVPGAKKQPEPAKVSAQPATKQEIAPEDKAAIARYRKMTGISENETSDKQILEYLNKKKTSGTRENKVKELAAYYIRQHKMTKEAAFAKAEKDVPKS